MNVWINTLLEEAEYYFAVNEFESADAVLDEAGRYRHLMDLETVTRMESLRIEIEYKLRYE